MILQGKVVGYDGETITIKAHCNKKPKNIKCEIRLDDGRKISTDQRMMIYATLKDIAKWSGHTLEEVKNICKNDFAEMNGAELFSLSDVDMTTAWKFQNYLIEFCIENGVQTSINLAERCPDISQYVYLCLRHRKCCVSGEDAELHHVDAVGMGRDREDIIHKGMRVLPLNRYYHTEAHTIGKKTFEEKYHLYPVELNDELCEIWGVKG